jgi:hypothetical protein
MRDEELLESTGARDGNVLHLIASLEQDRPQIPEDEPSNSLHRAGSGSSRSPQGSNGLGPAFENRVIADLLGNLGTPA